MSTTTIISFMSYLIFATIDVLLIKYFLDTKYKRRYKTQYIVSMTCILMLTIINLFFSRLRLESILCYFFIFYLIVSSYNIKLKHKFITTLLILIITIIVEFICMLIFEWIFDVHFKTNVFFRLIPLKIISLLLCRYFEYFILYSLVDKKHRSKIFDIHYFKIISSFMSLIFVSTMIFNNNNDYIPVHKMQKLLFVTLVIYNLAIFIFDRYQVKHEEAEKEYAEMKQRLEQENEFNIEREANDRKVRKMRHNMNNQLNTIHAYIKHNELDAAINYIQELSEELKKTSSTSHTGNFVIDSLINTKINTAKSLGITFKERYGLISFGDIKIEDINQILGCALDNAIEATDKVKEDRVIQMRFSTNTGYLVICIINPINVDKEIDFDRSSKIDNLKEHGYGVETIKDVMNKYNGNAFYERSKNTVTLNILIPLKVRKKRKLL